GLRERQGVGIGMDEDERAPGPDRDREQRELRAVEAGLALGARSRTQRPVEVVGPGVVGALQGLPPALALADERAAVPADVDEAAQLAVAPAHDDDRQLAGVCGEERARLGDLVCAARVLPEAREDSLLLEPEHRRVRVPA